MLILEPIFSVTESPREIRLVYSRDRCLPSIVQLTHFSPMSHFYTPGKREITIGFLSLKPSQISNVKRSAVICLQEKLSCRCLFEF